MRPARWRARGAAPLIAAALIAGCSSELVVLLPEEDGKVGALDVRSGSGAVTLDSAYAGARGGTLASVTAVSLEEAEVRRDFAAALEVEPPPPVSYVVYFEEGTTTVVASSRAEFERMLADVRGRGVAEVQVTGHTDRVGTVEDNDVLARQRAAMVRSVLLREGLDPTMVLAVGRGERAPLVATADEVREARNRRVEITVR